MAFTEQGVATLSGRLNRLVPAKAPRCALPHPSHAAVLAPKALEKVKVVRPRYFVEPQFSVWRFGGTNGDIARADKVRSLNSFKGRFLPGKNCKRRYLPQADVFKNRLLSTDFLTFSVLCRFSSQLCECGITKHLLYHKYVLYL